MREKRYFHVIMPVGSDPGWLAKCETIKRAASRNAISARFPNYLPHAPVFRLDDVKRELTGAAFVLADLTLERPSCYYELGLAEALDLPVRLIAGLGTPIHQSAARHEVQYYRDLRELEVVVDRAIGSFVTVPARIAG